MFSKMKSCRILMSCNIFMYLWFLLILQIKMAVQKSKFVSVIIDKVPAPDGAGVDLGRSEQVLYLKSVTECQTTMHFIERFNTEHPYDYQHVYKLVVKETLEQHMSQEKGDIWCKTVRFFVTRLHCFRSMQRFIKF